MPEPAEHHHNGDRPPGVAAKGPVGPGEGTARPFLLPPRAWFDATKRAIREFSTDAIPDDLASVIGPATPGEREPTSTAVASIP